MIVARITDVKGSCDIEGYREWIPLTSVQFGFQRDNKGAKGSDKEKEKEKEIEEVKPDEISTVSMNKLVDASSCDLMALAMQDRLKVKGQSKELTADICFLETVGGKVFAFIEIAMENVLVKAWSLDASGDERPSESTELWFEKVAMRYQSTADGKTFSPAGRKGWDQKGNESWTPARWT